MKKYKPLILLSTFSLLTTTACTKKEDPNKFYNDLYTSDYVEVYKDEVRLTNKAQYGYTLKNEQGYNSWYYMYGSMDNLKSMDYNEKKEAFIGKSSQLKGELMVSKKESAIRKYVSRMEGNGHIYGNFKCLNEESKNASINIYLNDEKIYSDNLKNGDIIGKYFEIPVTLKMNDEVYFEVYGDNAEVLFNPVVTIEESQNSTMYHLNSFGKQYGDVFPYYDEEDKKLKIEYLWTDDCLANNGNNYSRALDISSNMLKFESYNPGDNYDLFYEHYSEYFYQMIYDVSRYCDRSLYPYGVRDNFLYKDENRMYMIAGCYRYFDYRWDSDLVIYESDDPMGLSWTKPGNVIASYDKNLPECPSLYKIGDRWYAFVSVSHVTTHQIGGLQYWMGEPGEDFMEVDWSKSDINWLDGEDLCAARPTPIGDKFYMWGWITAKHDGVPLKPWAGYLNLPREIVQREDGTLGGRMDPGLVNVMNYGNIYTLNKDNYGVISGSTREFNEESNTLDLIGANNEIILSNNQTRNFITLDVDLKESLEAGLEFIQNGKKYTANIKKIDGEIWMTIESPDDSTHKVNSKLKIHSPSEDNKYQIKLVIDNGIIEFFVNDDNALTAKTSMNDSPYNILIHSNYGSSFSNIKINRLRSYADCEV